jgi:energy-coupling factor transporter ATP-binding protein EcfA2
MIERLQLKEFTAFRELDMRFSPGVNLMIGENATGKTHILKVLYAMLSSAAKPKSHMHTLQGAFLPPDDKLFGLVHQPWSGQLSRIVVTRDGEDLSVNFGDVQSEGLEYTNAWRDQVPSFAYVPVKEMLANAPGFRSLYASRNIHFESVYADIVDLAYLPPLKRAPNNHERMIRHKIEEILGGSVTRKEEEFYLTRKDIAAPIAFTLLAEGHRKFALLDLLIRNGTLSNGSLLLWDEPEANLNPILIEKLVEILLILQRALKVQVFLATHSYVVLKHFDLQRKSRDKIRFFSLKRDPGERTVSYISGDSYSDIVPNKISDAYSALYDLEVSRSLGIHAK